MKQCAKSYDKRIAGVIFATPHSSSVDIAVNGIVDCKVDANYGQIEKRDFLTTSENPGYAMKASDSTASSGAVISKALKSLKSGTGTIPILVESQ